MAKKRRSAMQFIKDCQRCETSTSKRCRCKTCKGLAHGINRETDHPLDVLLTKKEIESVKGLEIYV